MGLAEVSIGKYKQSPPDAIVKRGPPCMFTFLTVRKSACHVLGTRRVRLPGAPFPNLHLKVDKRLHATKMKHGLSGAADKNWLSLEVNIYYKNSIIFI